MTTAAAATEGAIDWHVRRHELGADEWVRFVAWLEADPAHARAYDALALLDRALPAPAVPVAANDDGMVGAPPYRRRLGWGAGAAALAACLALVVGVATRTAAPAGFSVTTRAGETREVALADGTRVLVAGASRLSFADRSARVEAGEAMFRVRHDAARPFTVTSGGVTLQDVGTAFDVARDGARLEVKVADGAVMVQPAGERLLVARGQAVVATGRALVRRAIDPADADGWAHGALRFDGAPLALVAAAFHRQTGAMLALEGDLPARDFTGMVRLSGVAGRDVPHLAQLIGATWRRRGEQWILAPEGAAR